MSKTITATPEILGVFASDNASTVTEIGNKLEMNVATVANSSNEVNIALPYYSNLDSVPEAITDAELDAAAGGVGVVENEVACAGCAVAMHAAGSITSAAMNTGMFGPNAATAAGVAISAAETAQETAAQQRNK